MSAELSLRDLDGQTVTIASAQLDAFRGAFRGPLLGAGDAGYDDARKIWNAMIDRRPGLIARCTGAADVLHAVRFARANRLLTSVRGGGHNIAGLAVCEGGLMIDLSGMRGVFVDRAARIAHAQGGCILADVDRETQLHGLAAVLGFISETGVGGLTVGGGFGYLTRRCGWTCDNVRSMQVVTPQGELVRAAADENPELFFALRGGGGNFGVVTSIEYELHGVGPEIVGGAVAWKGEDAPEVLSFFRSFIESSPRELTCVAVLRIAPPAPWLPKEIHGKPIVAMFACHTGRPEDGEKLVAPIKTFGKPVADILVRRPYAMMQRLLDATQPKGRRYYWKSEYLPGVDAGAAGVAVEHAARIPSPHSAFIFFQIGGALNELPSDHSPAGNRDATIVANITSSWESAADDAKNVEWAREAWRAVRPFSTGGVYVNFLTEEEGAERIAEAYGAGMLQKLTALKRKLDPENLFRHTKSPLPAG